MEPSSAEDGDSCMTVEIKPRGTSFNGAVLSRGRRRWREGRGSHGRCGFNGAVLSRGRRPGGLTRKARRDWASMEPSSAEDGDLGMPHPHAGAIERFNGAVLSRGRRQVEATLGITDSIQLQWSRPQQRTETSTAILSQLVAHQCFNGAVLSRGRRQYHPRREIIR